MKDKKKFNIVIFGIIVLLILVVFMVKKSNILFPSSKSQNKDKSIYNINDGKIHIVIDAGHGGPDPGAKNNKLHLFEKDITRKMADAVVKLTDTSIYAVLQTRVGDANINRHERMKLANAFHPQLLISLHCNDFHKGYVNGFEVGYSDSALNTINSTSKVNPNKSQAAKFAKVLSKTFEEAFPPMKNRGIRMRKDRIWMIYAGSYPSVLMEWGYISNRDDVEIMQDPLAHDVFGKAVWYAINEYISKNKVTDIKQ